MGKIKTGFGPEGLGGVSTKHDKEGGAGMVARRETPQKPRKTGPNLLGLITTPFIATAGAVALGTARGIKDAIDPTKPKIFDNKKKKEERGKLKEERDRKEKHVERYFEEVTGVIESARNLRNQEHRRVDLATSVLGKDNQKRIDELLKVNQRTPERIKPATPEEIEMAQDLLAENFDGDPEERVQREINRRALENLSRAGEKAVNRFEVRRLKTLRDRDHRVNFVSYGQGVVAWLLRAKGSRGESINGGYTVDLKNGSVEVVIGQDINEIAPIDEVTVDFDLPEMVKAVLSVCDGSLPMVKGIRRPFRWFVKTLVGYNEMTKDMPLRPGMIIVGKTGEGETGSYPTLYVMVHKTRIEILGKVGKILANRLREIENNGRINLDEPNEQKMLVDEVSRGVKNIPRALVVLKIMKSINPEFFKEKTAGRQQSQENGKLNIEEDLVKAGMAQMDSRSALNVVKNFKSIEELLCRKFGEDEGKRIAGSVKKKAEMVLGK